MEDPWSITRTGASFSFKKTPAPDALHKRQGAANAYFNAVC